MNKFIIHVNNFVVNHKNQLLLVKEKKEENYGKLNMPGGHLNHGEYIENGTIREALEEVNLQIIPDYLLKIFTGFNGNKHFIQFIYFIESNNLEPIANQNEILSCEWITIADIPNMNNEQFLNYDKIIECIKQYKNSNFIQKSIICELF